MTKRLLQLIILAVIAIPVYASSNTIEQARSYLQKVTDSGNFVTKLDPGSVRNNLPMGIRHTMGNTTVTLAVSKVRSMKEYCSMDIFARIFIPSKSADSPEDSIPLFFGAEGIMLSNDGDIVGDARLVLLQDVEIPIFDNNAKIILRGGISNSGQMADLTYANISCQGVTGFGIAADVEFSKSIMQTVSEDGKPNGGAVRASFQVKADDWEDWLAEATLPRFAIMGLDGFDFACEDIVFDFSHRRNGNVTFPKNYEANYLYGLPDVNLWQGFYAGRILVTVPEQFKGKKGGRLTFSANDLLIDENGISGLFVAETPILDFSDGNASGWRFSVDKFRVGLMANTLTEAAFAGRIGIPIADQKSSAFEYEGMWDIDNNYSMTVSVGDTVSFDVLQAQANIMPGSYIKLAVHEGVFRPEANLCGNLDLSVKSDKGDSIASFKGVVFQNLHIQTEHPYVSVDYFGYRNESSVMNMPVSITELGLTANDRSLNFYAGLKMDIQVTSASTSFALLGDLQEDDGIQQWRFKRFELREIDVYAEIGGVVKLRGRASARYDDPVYGNGYAGSLDLEVSAGVKFAIKASAVFGRVNGDSYWYVDASAAFTPPIPCAGYVNIGGFAGGMSYGMKRSGLGVIDSNAYNYIPDNNSGLGFKAGVILVIPSQEVASLKLMLEMEFNRYGGVNRVGFYGQGKFLDSASLSNMGGAKNMLSQTDEEVRKRPSANGIVANLAIEYDFVNDVLHSNFEIYVNFMEGFLKGVGAEGRAGWVTLHIEPKEWYLHIGTPSNPIGVELNALDIVRIQTTAYMMAGCNMPDALPVPPQIAEVFGSSELSSLSVSRNNDAFSKGKGFAFGSSLSIDTGELWCIILYARFQAGLGFDLMLRQYENAQCAGRSGTIGMDGWYATGQLYAYLAGELGVGVNLWFIKAKIPIIKGGAAVLLQGMLPNPTWFGGKMGVNFSILGGLIKGSIDFKFELGEKCNLLVPGQSPLDMEVIGDISPSESDVDVFSVPQVAFNIGINKPFETRLDEGFVNMMAVIDNCTLTNMQTGAIVQGEWSWNDEKDKYSFYPHEILDPETTFKINVSVGFRQYKEGVWSTVYTSGQASQEKREVVFVTGKAPDYIPDRNIEYSYPVRNQRNFHKEEYGHGYIRLKQGQTYLFADSLMFTADFINEDGDIIASQEIKYDKSSKTIKYDVPSQLPVGTELNVNLCGRPKDAEVKSVKNEAVYKKLSGVNADISTKHNVADSEMRTDIGKSILSYAFRTSKYKTFRQKVNSMSLRGFWDIENSYSTVLLGLAAKADESFDAVDLFASEWSAQPLVTVRSTGDDAYYKQNIYPNLYSGYSSSEFNVNRDTSVIGVPPLNAITVSPYYSHCLSNGDEGGMLSVFPHIYRLSLYYSSDFYDLLGLVMNRWVQGGSLNDYEKRLIKYSVPSMPRGKYKSFVSYTIPGGIKTSDVEVYYKY